MVHFETEATETDGNSSCVVKNEGEKVVKIEQQKDHGTIVIIQLDSHVFGGSQAVEFTSQIHHYAAQGVRWFIVDLQDVTVMNSSGLGMLVSGLTTLRKFNGQLLLTNVPEQIQHLLHITHLDKVFLQFPSREEALSYIEQHKTQ